MVIWKAKKTGGMALAWADVPSYCKGAWQGASHFVFTAACLRAGYISHTDRLYVGMFYSYEYR